MSVPPGSVPGMATMTKDEALRALAERVSFDGDDGLRDAVLEALGADQDQDTGEQLDGVDGAETVQADQARPSVFSDRGDDS